VVDATLERLSDLVNSAVGRDDDRIEGRRLGVIGYARRQQPVALSTLIDTVACHRTDRENPLVP
jgi:hypothetical protein